MATGILFKVEGDYGLLCDPRGTITAFVDDPQVVAEKFLEHFPPILREILPETFGPRAYVLPEDPDVLFERLTAPRPGDKLHVRGYDNAGFCMIVCDGPQAEADYEAALPVVAGEPVDLLELFLNSLMPQDFDD